MTTKLLLKRIAFVLVLFSAQLTIAQTTEVFETETAGSTSFTDNGRTFNITSQARGPFDIQTAFPGTGWNGTAADNRYIDNDTFAVGGLGVGFTINCATPFVVNNFWIYLANNSANVNVTGSLTIVGKLAGVTKYTATQSSGFNTNGAVNAGFSLINLSTFGSQNNSNIAVDELVITTLNNFNYVALDAFNWTIPLPEINVKGNGTSIVDGDPSPSATDHSDFGNQSVCSGSVVRTFTVENTGLGNLAISSVSISGTNAADFAVTSAPAGSVSPAGTTTFQVTFNPSASGTRSATITINNDDSNEAAYDFAIQGAGIDPEVNVQGNGNSITDGDSTPSLTDHTSFGSQSVCSGTIVRTFTIQNTGTSNLVLANPTMSGTHASDFSVTSNPSSPVAAAGSTTFQITFNPSSVGTRLATVTFTTNDCNEATYDFSILGTGIDPEVNVQGNGNSIADGDATSSLTDHSDFGSQLVCSGTIVRTFTIQNTGISNLTLANPVITGLNASDFSVTANPSSPVTAAGSTTFQVTFNPSASGGRFATVTFTSDDCDEATYDFAVQGTGTLVDDTVASALGILTANQNGATYQWYQCPSTLLSGATNQSYTPTIVGDYKVEITFGGCVITSSCITLGTLATNDFEINSGLKIYPNPTANNVTIELNDSDKVSLQVYDITGKMLLNQLLSKTVNSVNIEEFQAGTYLFKVSSAKGSATSRVIKR
ncbi:choice-of-anchor D domain-containing protein [Flavobacterium sp.]|uniref:choice-of-anchor D domain-containing protein n=1 Tax=Flavobacterium sp. TaxID=239 RepID=UPI00260539EF|nr:choice-of-anchor D domain-containing protein [Flavobacterium sp.]